MNEKRTPRITKKRAEKYKEQLNLGSIEIASKAQELIKLRIERALHSERELDEFMNELLIHAGECNDKAKSKAIISIRPVPQIPMDVLLPIVLKLPSIEYE